MGPDELRNFHYITHITNLDSILERGIVCHSRADSLPHKSVANEEIQARRAIRRLPNGRRLHDYAPLYIDARNAMLYLLALNGGDKTLGVIEVSRDVLRIPGTLITDGNAASGEVLSSSNIFTPEEGVRTLRVEDVYCESWTSPDPYVKQERKRKRMAEVLVPDRIDPDLLLRILVSNDETLSLLIKRNYGIMVDKDEHLFFR
jgi:hypothetical protein